IDIVPVVTAVAERQFRRAGGRRVIAEMNRPAEGSCDLLLDVEAAPLLKHVMGGADLALPVPDLEGSGNADAADARELSRPQVTRDGLKALFEEEHGLLGRRVAERAMGRAANAAGEIEQHEIGAAAADLEAERVRAIRVER